MNHSEWNRKSRKKSNVEGPENTISSVADVNSVCHYEKTWNSWFWLNNLALDECDCSMFPFRSSFPYIFPRLAKLCVTLWGHKDAEFLHNEQELTWQRHGTIPSVLQGCFSKWGLTLVGPDVVWLNIWYIILCSFCWQHLDPEALGELCGYVDGLEGLLPCPHNLSYIDWIMTSLSVEAPWNHLSRIPFEHQYPGRKSLQGAPQILVQMEIEQRHNMSCCVLSVLISSCHLSVLVWILHEYSFKILKWKVARRLSTEVPTFLTRDRNVILQHPARSDSEVSKV